MKPCEGALIFLLGLSSFAANVVAPTKSELETMYAGAAQALNGGDVSGALKQLDAIDARQPDMAAAKNLRGVALMRIGEYGVAEKALQKATRTRPRALGGALQSCRNFFPEKKLGGGASQVRGTGRREERAGTGGDGRSHSIQDLADLFAGREREESHRDRGSIASVIDESGVLLRQGCAGVAAQRKAGSDGGA